MTDSILSLGNSEEISPEAKKQLSSILTDLGQATRLNGHASLGLNQLRRDMFKKSLKAEVQRLATGVDEAEPELFGSDLARRTAEAIAASKLVRELRAPASSGDLREKLNSSAQKRTVSERGSSSNTDHVSSKNEQSSSKGSKNRRRRRKKSGKKNKQLKQD